MMEGTRDQPQLVEQYLSVINAQYRIKFVGIKKKNGMNKETRKQEEETDVWQDWVG